jgi:nucleoside-diphosphate-sugar epimerase
MRDRVHVDDAIDAVVRFLQLHEVDDRAEIVAEMQIACRLDA